MKNDPRPLVAHVMYRFDTGGLENGIVNLINHMPAERYRHAVIALTEVTDFRKRIIHKDVQFFGLQKPPGHALWIYPQLFKLFRQLRPAIVHSRNLGALEVVVPAWAAGVAVRVHGEHGRDGSDLDGSSKKYQWVRRIYRPFVTHYIALSRDLEQYLTVKVGMPKANVAQIYNGVDAKRFYPAGTRQAIDGCPFTNSTCYLIGTVGRMQAIKDQTTLTRAFIHVLASAPELKEYLRLVMVGDGALRTESQALLEQAGCLELAWLPGERNDVPEILRGLDCFVLPSLSEGISNAILEAMASGLPVIATDVGGNSELVEARKTGELVPVGGVEAMAKAIIEYARNRERGRIAGQLGRAAVERQFSMAAMISQYQGLYDNLLKISDPANENNW